MKQEHVIKVDGKEKSEPRAERALTRARMQADVGDDALLRIETVIAWTGMSRTSLYASIRASKFPAPIKLGERCARWRAGSVRQWLAAPQR